MKIYNWKNFASGLLLVLLGLALLITGIIKGFQLKRLTLALLCLLFGVSALLRSLSRIHTREDRLHEREERDQLIALKSRSRALGLTQTAGFLLMLVFFLAAKLSGYEGFVAMGVGIGFILSISMIAHLCAAIYEESKN